MDTTQWFILVFDDADAFVVIVVVVGVNIWIYDVFVEKSGHNWSDPMTNALIDAIFKYSEASLFVRDNLCV